MDIIRKISVGIRNWKLEALVMTRLYIFKVGALHLHSTAQSTFFELTAVSALFRAPLAPEVIFDNPEPTKTFNRWVLWMFIHKTTASTCFTIFKRSIVESSHAGNPPDQSLARIAQVQDSSKKSMPRGAAKKAIRDGRQNRSLSGKMHTSKSLSG